MPDKPKPPTRRRITGFQNVSLPQPDGQPIPTLIAFASDGTCWAVNAAPGGASYTRIPELPQDQ